MSKMSLEEAVRKTKETLRDDLEEIYAALHQLLWLEQTELELYKRVGVLQENYRKYEHQNAVIQLIAELSGEDF